MARVTVEDCLEKVPNRFALIVLAADRARQLAHGARPLVDCTNKVAVTSLREIAQGSVRFNESVEATLRAYIAETAIRAGETAPRRRGLAARARTAAAAAAAAAGTNTTT